MDDVCFSGPALILLGSLLTGAIGIISTVVGILFRGWIRALEKQILSAETRATDAEIRLDQSLNIGETIVQRRGASRR